MKKENVIVTVILAVVVILATFSFYSFYTAGMFTREKPENKVIVRTIESEMCLKYAGVWNEEFDECEGLSLDTCLVNGGYFNECASACRHNPAADMCTLQCVPVCEYAVLNSKADLIRPYTPRPNQIFEGAQIQVNGTARGTWYFEGSFPIQVKDLENNVLLQSFATAQSEWMTEDFVLYKTMLDISGLKIKGKLQLVLQRDNPSGLPEQNDELIIPFEIK